jgi:hypothetical protein
MVSTADPYGCNLGFLDQILMCIVEKIEKVY